MTKRKTVTRWVDLTGELDYTTLSEAVEVLKGYVDDHPDSRLMLKEEYDLIKIGFSHPSEETDEEMKFRLQREEYLEGREKETLARLKAKYEGG